jgi:hypothetical protein
MSTFSVTNLYYRTSLVSAKLICGPAEHLTSNAPMDRFAVANIAASAAFN